MLKMSIIALSYVTGSTPVTWAGKIVARGLPIGLQVVGRLEDEVTVLRASAAFEKARPWTGKRPPVS